MCHAVHRYEKTNNKYMKNYDKKEESSYIQYLDLNNMYGCAMSQKLSVGGFKWIEDVSEIDEDFIKNYDENSDIGSFLKVDINYPKELHDLHSDLPFLPKRMKINKYSKLVCNLYDKKKLCCLHKSFKTSVNAWFKTKKGS